MPRNTKKIPQNPSSPHPFYPYPRYTHQTDQTLQAHFIDELPKTWGLRMPTQICLNPESTRAKIQFQEPQWISVYSGLGLRHPPFPSFFQMNPCQKTTCRKHFLGLISTHPNWVEVSFWQFSMCAGLIFTAVWGHGTCQPGNDTYHIFPFFLDDLPIEVVRFSTDHQRYCKSQGGQNLEVLRSPIWSACQQQSKWKQTFQRNEHHGNLTKSKPFGPIPIDPYMKQLLRNIKLKNSLIVSLQSTIQQQLQ